METRNRLNNLMNLWDKEITVLPPSLPQKVENFDCSNNKLTNLIGSPNVVGDYFDCNNNYLTDLIGSPSHVGGEFKCSYNNLTSLNGSPFRVECFNCSHNQLTTLIWSPNQVGDYFHCNNNNNLTSLFGAPTKIKGYFYIRNNPNLLDISDIWESKIGGSIYLDISSEIALLPLIKFRNIITDLIIIDKIHKRNQGSSKQNILNFQYDLIENGFEENAKWKPL